MDEQSFKNLLNSEQEWRKYLIIKIDSLERHISSMEVKFNAEIATLKAESKAQSAMWGFIAGLLPTLLAIAVTFFSKDK